VNEPNKPNSPKKQPNPWIKYSGLAIQMGAIIAVGTWGGVELDKKFQYKFPLFTVILTLLSVFAAIYYTIRDFIK
jgi:F0F1-type ATP synthase assembly protein I